MKFLVLGLPRSRTAWLANFLTYDGQFCFHEGTDGCNSIEEYKQKVKDKGDSNTGLIFYEFKEHFPDVKIIIIDSDVESSIEFGKEVFNADVSNELIIAKKMLDETEGLHIALEDINDHLREIWEYVSDKEFDKDRADMLVKMNVQVSDPLDIDYESIKNFMGTVNVCHPLH